MEWMSYFVASYAEEGERMLENVKSCLAASPWSGKPNLELPQLQGECIESHDQKAVYCWLWVGLDPTSHLWLYS